MLTQATRPDYRTLFSARHLNPDTMIQGADGDRTTIVFVSSDADPIRVTRAAFFDGVGRYAFALHKLGIAWGRDELVVIAHTDTLESIYAFWGAMWYGAIPSMFPTLTEKLDPAIYTRNMAELTARSGVRAILTTDTFAPVLAPHVPCPVYGDAQIAAALADEMPPEYPDRAYLGKLLARARIGGDDYTSDGKWGNSLYDVFGDPNCIALLQHSSGTTGLQKGVALTHRAVLNQLASYSDALQLNADDVVVSWLPLYHDMGLIAGFILPIVQGIPLVLMSPFDWVRHPALLVRALHEYRGTLCWLPNFAYNHLARVRERDIDGVDLSRVRAFINCSEPVRHDSHARFLERFASNGVRADQLAVSYAMAENTFAVTQTAIGQPAHVDWVAREALQHDLAAMPLPPTDEQAAPQVSCGKPLASVALKLVGDSGLPLGERQVGAVYVQSDSMLTGYYARPDLQPFDGEGWYATGDRGYVADGELYIVGRTKDLIIAAGRNIYPQDIEAVLYDIEGIHPGRAVAFGIEDREEGTELLAVVAEVDTDDAEARQRINAAVRQRIGKATDVTVSYVTLVERGWLIKTSSGKTARGANRDKWLRERSSPN